jgi:hypothetical protein
VVQNAVTEEEEEEEEETSCPIIPRKFFPQPISPLRSSLTTGETLHISLTDLMSVETKVPGWWDLRQVSTMEEEWEELEQWEGASANQA